VNKRSRTGCEETRSGSNEDLAGQSRKLPNCNGKSVIDFLTAAIAF
jgi:hypothetical protein